MKLFIFTKIDGRCYNVTLVNSSGLYDIFEIFHRLFGGSSPIWISKVYVVETKSQSEIKTLLNGILEYLCILRHFCLTYIQISIRNYPLDSKPYILLH
jgi:hypothetical protein